LNSCNSKQRLNFILASIYHTSELTSSLSPQFEDLGMVTSIESNHKNVQSARKGMEVCIKIEPYPGETPKMFGRHFDETDMLVSKVSFSSPSLESS
jgi:translation initiation factor IF-2